MNGNCHPPPPPPLEVYPIPLITEAVLYPKKKKRKEERKRNQTQDQLIFKRYTQEDLQFNYNYTTSYPTCPTTTPSRHDHYHHHHSFFSLPMHDVGTLGCPLHIVSLVKPSMPPNFSLPSPSRLSSPFPLSFTYLIIAGSYLLGPGGSPLILPQ